MKSKIYILILILCLVAVVRSFSQTRVPDRTYFTFGTVSQVVNGDSAAARNLDATFTNSNAAYFNATYGSKTMSPKTLYGFRDYGPSSVFVPTVTTTTASSITATTASSGGNVTSDGGGSVSARGVVWSTSTNPTITSHTGGGITTDGTGTGVFTSSITGTTGNNTYYYKAYATNSAGDGYGSELNYNACWPTMNLYYAILDGSCGTGGFATSFAGSLSAIGKINGICGITSVAAFSVSVESITVGKIVYDGTTCTNLYSGGGFGYWYLVTSGSTGNNQIVTINSSNSTITAVTQVNQPTLNGLVSATNITSTGFTTGSNCDTQGYDAVTEKGILVAVGNVTPTLSNSTKFPYGSGGTGSYTVSPTGLSANTQYSYRAYALNSAGYGLGGSVFTVTTQPALIAYTTTTTWTCPTGVSSVTVACWGGGGAGGGATGTASRGGGGAGGSYATSVVSVSPGSYAITIGAGGIASTTATRPGGNTTFGATLVRANGGAGAVTTSGTNGNGATAVTTNSVGTTIYIGGNGGDGVAAGTSGGGGGGAGSTGAGNNATLGTAGAAKANSGGAGGNGVTTANTRNVGGVYGGGGSGGLSSTTTDRTGGSGGAGRIELTFP